jgi:predicted membrane-bound dolichyl-phosphate-mannose-protein mannosyltransferase
MEVIKQLLQRLGKWEYIWLCLLVLVTLAMHFSIIAHPDEEIFDELYYVPDARLILMGEGTSQYEHPPLGKFFIALGIVLFGNNPFGWRFFSIIFGTLCIVMFYLICRQLSMSKRASYIATFLLSFETLSFVQASVAMLDIYSVGFMLISFWLYLKGQYPLAGLSVGLSTLAKLSGALVLPVILLHWLLARRDRYRKFITSMFLAPISFLLLLPLFGLVTLGELVNPIERIRNIISLSSSLTLAYVPHGCANRPWDWILSGEIIPYWCQPNYFAVISYTILPLIIPTVLYLLFIAARHNDAGLFSVSWFSGTYILWIPMVLITDRATYVYYFLPTIGAVCIGLGLVMTKLIDIWDKRKTGKLRWVLPAVVVLYLLLHVSFFVTYSPMSMWFTGTIRN